MHARKTLLQLLIYLCDTNEDSPASRFPSVLISQCLFDARFECKRDELRSILSKLIDLGYNPLTRDQYEIILVENVLSRI